MTSRRGFTLLEVLLSLFLSAVVAVLIGGLVQLFLVNESRGREQLRQTQTARAILNMIAEDIRTTVRYQPYDTSALQQMLSGAAGSMLGGMGGGGAGGGGSGGGAPAGSTAGGGGTGDPSGGGGAAAGSTPSPAGPTIIPPGIFGNQLSIEIDVSRMPRPDEYVIQLGDVSRGTLGDMPSDIKTVGYYVQSPRADGVLDPLAQIAAQSSEDTRGSGKLSGGLVRRSLDRAVTQFAYANGNTTQISRTGEVIAPEVISIEFSYFNANSGWQTQWDSSQLGLPHVVKVTLAIQSEAKARTNPIEPGLMLSTITAGMIEEYGIRLYSTNVIIPGSMLLSAPSSQAGTGTSNNGMSSLGL
jgi:prepilin-type N-terminal cleavage/methylation domain-containing protein